MATATVLVALAAMAGLPRAAQPSAAAAGRAAVAPLRAPIEQPMAAPPPVPAAVPDVGAIEADSSEIRIDVHSMPLVEAARQLAAATHTQLEGWGVLGDANAQITLKWNGRSAGAAWQQLLAADTSFAAECGTRDCKVWVLGSLAPQRGATTAATSEVGNGSGSSAVRGSPVMALTHETRSLPLPEASAAPAPLAAPTPQPDPPGLFPADG